MWKAKQKQDYFFGSVDANRVQLSIGRDIALSFKQDGPALNYFVYPYVEVDGKPYDKLDKQFNFEEANPRSEGAISKRVGRRLDEIIDTTGLADRYRRTALWDTELSMFIDWPETGFREMSHLNVSIGQIYPKPTCQDLSFLGSGVTFVRELPVRSVAAL